MLGAPRLGRTGRVSGGSPGAARAAGAASPALPGELGLVLGNPPGPGLVAPQRLERGLHRGGLGAQRLPVSGPRAESGAAAAPAPGPGPDPGPPAGTISISNVSPAVGLPWVITG